MGTSTIARCTTCDYEASLRLGGGMVDHMTYAAWPVSCRRCPAITTANFKASPLACVKCGTADVTPMNDVSLWQGDGRPVLTWDDLTLSDGHHRCPKGDSFTLRFKPGLLLWD